MVSRKDFKRIEYKTIEGKDRIISFHLLKRKHASKVYADTVKIALKALGSLTSAGDDPAKIFEALDSLDHDAVIWPLAEALLEGAILEFNPGAQSGVLEIHSLEDTDFFDDNWDEMYLLIWHGIQANYPKSLARLRAKLQGLGLKPKGLDNIFDTPSQTSKPTPMQSPSGTE